MSVLEVEAEASSAPSEELPTQGLPVVATSALPPPRPADAASLPDDAPVDDSRVADPEAQPAPRVDLKPLPALAKGTRLLGPYRSSGLAEERFLVRRGDARMALLSTLVYRVAEALDGKRNAQEVAACVHIDDKALSPDAVELVVERKLRPLGLLEVGPDRAPVAPPSAPTPILTLAARRTLVRERTVRAISHTLMPLFYAPIVIAVLAAMVFFDIWLFGSYGVTSAFAQVLTNPGLVLAAVGLVAVSMLFHEFGHASACRYGGGRPGAIGMGMYIMFPAFYTNVTDAYRLGRLARIRTDLGGVYFNAVFVVLLAPIVKMTGSPILIVVITLTHFAAMQQMVPVVRLDGYYVLSDLVGVPDLFARIKPLMRTLVPWKREAARARARAAELRPAARRIVTAWVLVVVPTLAAGTTLLVLRLPRLVRTSSHGITLAWHALGDGWQNHEYARSAYSVFTILTLLMPFIGISLIGGRLLKRVWLTLERRRVAAALPLDLDDSADDRAEDSKPDRGRKSKNVSAVDPALTDECIVKPTTPAAQQGWRRSVYVASRGHLRLAPGRAELEAKAKIDVIRTPTTGARRIVVLCRKGGTGKTTTTLMLGHYLAMHRGDRVVAVDANPDAGSLAFRVERGTERNITHLLADGDSLTRYVDVRSYTSQSPTRLEVVASHEDPRVSQKLGRSTYYQVMSLLERFYSLILVDTGTGILDSAVQGILMEADQVVVVLPPALDGAKVAAATLDWLDQHRYSALVRSAVCVINGVQNDRRVELGRIEDYFARRCAAVVKVPWDRELAAGAVTLPTDLAPATQDAYLELATAVASQFSNGSPRRKRSR